jgi:hypothetical protein
MKEIEKNEPMDFGTKVGAAFLILFVLYGIGYVTYYKVVKAKSVFKYSIAVIVDDCNINSTLGNLFEYKVDGEIFKFCRVDPFVRELREGDRLLVKYYLDDPSAYELLEIKVPKAVVVPTEGWDKIPNF